MSVCQHLPNLASFDREKVSLSLTHTHTRTHTLWESNPTNRGRFCAVRVSCHPPAIRVLSATNSGNTSSNRRRQMATDRLLLNLEITDLFQTHSGHRCSSTGPKEATKFDCCRIGSRRAPPPRQSSLLAGQRNTS